MTGENNVTTFSFEAMLANIASRPSLLGSRSYRSKIRNGDRGSEQSLMQNMTLKQHERDDATGKSKFVRRSLVPLNAKVNSLSEQNTKSASKFYPKKRSCPQGVSPFFKDRSIRKNGNSSSKRLPLFSSKKDPTVGHHPMKQKSFVFENEVKRNLNFAATIEEDEVSDDCIPPCDLSSSLLNQKPNVLPKSAHKQTSFRFQQENDKENRAMNETSIRYPLLQSRRRSVIPKLVTDNSKPALLITRRSMVNLPSPRKNFQSSVSPIPAIKVIRPSVEEDEFAFVEPSIINVKRNKSSTGTTTTTRNDTSVLPNTKSFVDARMSVKSDSQNNCSCNAKVQLQAPKLMKDASTNTLVTGLYSTTDYQQMEQALLTSINQQREVMEAAQLFFQVMKDSFEDKSKIFIEQLQQSVSSVASIRKEFEDKFSLNEREYVLEPRLDCDKKDVPVSSIHDKYRFLGTPMPHKKTVGRSVSHPELNSDHPMFSPLNESFHSMESLSPFTNLAGDSDRPSLAPLTPKTKTNISALKNNLNEQFNILFK